MSKVTVACVLWYGDFRKRGYTSVWVERLKNMVERNLHIDHDFVCLSNIDIQNINVIPLEDDLKGWWSKLEIFKGHLPNDKILYLDLDLLILKDLEPFLNYQGSMSICKAFGGPSSEKKTVHGYNSSIMAFDKEYGKKIYKKFKKEHMSRFRGDQDFIKYYFPNLNTFPKGWVTKLRYCKEKERLPSEENKVVLSMPWKNDVACKTFKWVKKIWI